MEKNVLQDMTFQAPETPAPGIFDRRGVLYEERLSEEMFTALHRGEIERLRRLLARGGSPDAKNREGYSLLMVAVVDQFEEAVEAILGAFADPGLKGPGGITAMILAAAGGNIAIAKLLMQEYVDLSDELDGADAADIARQHGRYDLAQMIEQRKMSEAYLLGVEMKKKQVERAKAEHDRSFLIASFLGAAAAAPVVIDAADRTPGFAKAFATAASRSIDGLKKYCSRLWRKDEECIVTPAENAFPKAPFAFRPAPKK